MKGREQETEVWVWLDYLKGCYLIEKEVRNGVGGGRKRRTRQVLKSSMNEKDWPVGQQIAAQESGWYSFRARALADSVIHPTGCF